MLYTLAHPSMSGLSSDKVSEVHEKEEDSPNNQLIEESYFPTAHPFTLRVYLYSVLKRLVNTVKEFFGTHEKNSYTITQTQN